MSPLVVTVKNGTWFKCDSKLKFLIKMRLAKKSKIFKKTVDKKKVIWYYKRVGMREPKTTGSIAQLVEHMPYKHGVTGSSPVVPTTCFLVVQGTMWLGSSVG